MPEQEPHQNILETERAAFLDSNERVDFNLLPLVLCRFQRAEDAHSPHGSVTRLRQWRKQLPSEPMQDSRRVDHGVCFR